MKILLVHKFMHVTGGAEVFVLETARVLRDNGHEVGFFSTVHENNINDPDIIGLVDSPNYRDGSFVGRSISVPGMIWSMKKYKYFKKCLELFRPDVVHVFAINVHITPSILFACKEVGVPVVMTCNDYKHICPNYKLFYDGKICFDCKGGRFFKAVTNRCFKNSIAFGLVGALEGYFHDFMNVYRDYVDIFTFSSEFMAKVTSEFWGGDFKYDFLLNPYSSANDFDRGNRGEYFLYFGRLVEEKGVDIVVRAASLCPGICFKIVGDGEDSSRLRLIADSLNLTNVQFVGPAWGDALTTLIDDARAVIVPSIWHENFPYVIVQSFAKGKPVIGSNRGGIPELVADGLRGFVYEADSPEQLASHVKKLWFDEKLSHELGRAAKMYADSTFSDERQLASLMAIYNRVA